MRARGAKVTDIVILVVAADDGVMPQTVEAIAHAKAAGVPIIVAINKIDKGDANPTRVKTELLQHEIQVEDMGGEVQAVEVSATKGINLDKLLRRHRAAGRSSGPEGQSRSRRRRRGDRSQARQGPRPRRHRAGAARHPEGRRHRRGRRGMGQVRLLANERGETVKEAGPSTPIEVLGLSAAPEAGDEMVVVESESRAREVAEYRARKRREQRQATSRARRWTSCSRPAKRASASCCRIVMKADVQGSAEAIEGALEKLGTDEVGVQILQSGVGGLTESDVILAHASRARRCSASMSAPMPWRATAPSATAWKSATTTSSTTWWMT